VRHRRRQERWLHARISEELEDALKREARRRRLPVSLLVRHVLEGALDLVEDLVENSMEVARRSRDLARSVGGRQPRDVEPPDGGEPPDGIYGWQELVLNRAAACARCDAALLTGAHAYRGLREHAGPPVFLCLGCVGRLQRPAAAPTGEEEEAT
jgi:hypothetical protein